MGIMNRSLWVTVAVLVTVGLTMASDPDPLQDFCVAYPSEKVVINGQPCKPPAKVTYGDFWSPALTKSGNTKSRNMSNVTQALVAQFPGLNTLGIGAARIDFAKGGINPSHTHPKATEILLVVRGELNVGFVGTNNTLFAATIKEGELFVFPRGLVHFQLNVGKGPELAFAALNSQPGHAADSAGIVLVRGRGRGVGEGLQNRRQDRGLHREAVSQALSVSESDTLQRLEYD